MAEKIHMVPVPESALPAVYELLASLTSADLRRPGSGSNDWSKADMQALARMVKNEAGRAMITLIARRSVSGKTATYEDLRAVGEKAVGNEFTYSQVRAQLSWFSKYCKKLKGESIWPLEIETARNEAPQGERHIYSMNEVQAKAWLEAVK